MGDEAQRYIREARARALARAGITDECAAQPPGTRQPSGTRQSPPVSPPGECVYPPPPPPVGNVCTPPSGGAIRRPQQTSLIREPPVQQLLPMSPGDRGQDPERMAYLSRVHQLSQHPVPQPCSPQPQQSYPTWDYEVYGGAGYEDPTLWEEVQSFDPCTAAGAEGPDPQGSASYYDILSEIREPEVDLTGGVEDILGRARHRAMLGAGYRRDVPLYPAPHRPGTAAEFDEGACALTEGPTLDEILAGAPQLPPPVEGYNACQELGLSTTDEYDDDLGLLPGWGLQTGDIGSAQSAQTACPLPPGGNVAPHCAQNTMTDEFGLPFRQYPHAEKARQEKLRRQQAEAMRRREEAARAQAEEQQRLAQAAAEEAARAEAAARAACARPTRGGRPGTRPTSGRAPARAPARTPTGTRTQAGPSRATSSAPRPSTSGTRASSTPRAAGGTCPPAGRRPPFHDAEKAAKVAAAAAATRARTQYKPPQLKSRPPPKPATVPKPPRVAGLDKNKKPDPTRDMMYCPVDDFGLEGAPFDDSPTFRPLHVGGPVEEMPIDTTWGCPQQDMYAGGQEPVSPELLAEVTGIINETRERLNATINRYR